MSATIQCEYRMTLDEYQNAHRWTVRFSPQLRLTYLLLLATGLVLILLGILRVIEGGHWDQFGFFLAAGGAILSLPWLRRRRVRGLFLSSPHRDQPIAWEINAQRFTLTTPASRYESDWSTISRVVRCDDGFLLFAGNNFARWLPSSAFRSESDQAQLVTWATQSAARYEDRRSNARQSNAA